MDSISNGGANTPHNTECHERHSRRRMVASSWRVRVVMCVALAAVAAGCALASSYVYDANGRLIVVTSETGESVRYNYDALGNIAQIERLSVGPPEIFGFSPRRGARGTQVTIEGQGFSSVPSQNSILFNGAPAVVATASSTEISASVPANATTGPIEVTVGELTAQSQQTFVVDEGVGPPLISKVHPLVAAVGTLISVEGERLKPFAGPNAVRLNRTAVMPSVETETDLSFSVPSGVGSGRVSVANSRGIAVSAEDIVVLPPDHASVDVTQVARLPIDGAAQSFSVVSGNHYVAVLFEGSEDEHLSVQLSSLGAQSITMKLYGVDNTRLQTFTPTPTHLTAHLPTLPSSGTYLLLIKPNGAPASWEMAIERDREIMLDQESASVSMLPGQSERLIFQSDNSQAVGLGVSNLEMSSGTYLNLEVYEPPATPWSTPLTTAWCYKSNAQCDINLQPRSTGAHSLIISPASSDQAITLAVFLSSELQASLMRDEIFNVELDRVGQNGRLVFSANAGERLEAKFQNLITMPTGRQVYYRVYQPDGSLLTSGSSTGSLAVAIETPVTGAYAIWIDPSYGARTQLTVNLSESVPARLFVDGEPVSVSTSLAGQIAELTFEGVAGQDLGLGITNAFADSNSDRYLSVYVYGPDGSTVAGKNGCWTVSGCDLNIAISESGEHRVRVSSFASVFRFTATLNVDRQLSLASGVKAYVSVDRPGMNAQLSFAGLVGQSRSVLIASGSNTDTYYRIYQPDGLLLTSIRSRTTRMFEVPSLPMTGEYLIFVDPVDGKTMTAHVQVGDTSFSTDLQPDSVSLLYPLGSQQESSHFTFEIINGQYLGLGVSDLQMDDMEYGIANVSLFDSEGAYLDEVSCYVSQSGCDIDLGGLADGIYHVIVRGSSRRRVGFRATLSSEVSRTLLPASVEAITLERAGQDARLLFDGMAGQPISLRVAGQVTNHAEGAVDYLLFDPSGNLILWETISGNGVHHLDMPALLESGTYQVKVDPNFAATASFQVVLAE